MSGGSPAFVTKEREDAVAISSSSFLGQGQGSTEDEDLKHGEEKMQLHSGLGNLDGFNFETYSSPFQVFTEEVITHSEELKTVSPQEKKPQEFPLASLGLLKSYQCKLNQVSGVKVDAPSLNIFSKEGGQKLSTNAIIRHAAERFIQSYSQGVDDISVLPHPFATSFLGFSAEDNRDVDLVGYVLAAAEKVDKHQFTDASRLLSLCYELCSAKGNPVQRLVYYFSQALQERVNQETGRTTSKGTGNMPWDLEEALLSPKLANVSFHQKVPFSQVSQHTGVQAIVEHVAGAKKLHLIELAIMNGCFCVMLMQALAARIECPIEHLKVTAVGTKFKESLEETGKRLISFAQSINLPLSFHVVVVGDMLDLKKSLFELDSDERIVVYSSYVLSNMITRPDRLDCLLRVIRSLNPCIMVMQETEGNLNSPVFVYRFVEALFLHGALFDSLGDAMENEDTDRMFIESSYFYVGIKSFVAVDGEERGIRHVNINVWREFFSRFGMVQLDMAPSCLEQAHLVIKNVSCWSSCTIDTAEKTVIIGWKGTPLFSVSCWKFV